MRSTQRPAGNSIRCILCSSGKCQLSSIPVATMMVVVIVMQSLLLPYCHSWMIPSSPLSTQSPPLKYDTFTKRSSSSSSSWSLVMTESDDNENPVNDMMSSAPSLNDVLGKVTEETGVVVSTIAAPAPATATATATQVNGDVATTAPSSTSTVQLLQQQPQEPQQQEQTQPQTPVQQYQQIQQQQQRMLQEVLNDRNSGSVMTEKKYAIADGSLLDRLSTMEVDSSATTEMVSSSKSSSAEAAASNDSTNSESTPTSLTTTTAIVPIDKDNNDISKLQRKINRIVEPRAYPLFLLEKGVEIMEAIVDDTKQWIQDIGLDLGGISSTVTNDTTTQKERIVVLGTGWGGVSFLKDIRTDIYDVTVISPRNHFVFTPMLAGASVGTVELRTICEPIREINRDATFYEATATSIDTTQRLVTCESVICEGNSCTIESFDVPYDRLIVTVGAQTNTYGIPGVKEHCNFLKSIPDARRIKSAIVNCFERANLPNLSDAERINCLTFAVIGAGPTGIEFAAELRDFVEQDGPKYYPELLKFVRIKVIEASPTILAPFDKSLQQEAIKQMQRDVSIVDPSVRALLPEHFELTELLLESSVKEVGDKIITLKDGRDIPYGIAVWAAGNGPIPLTLQIIDDIGSEQKALQDSIGRGRLVVDPWLRVIGSQGRVLALGDCSCASSAPRQLPATAQVAAQQGEYMAKLFNKKYDYSPLPNTDDGATIFPPPVKVPGVTETSLSDEIASFAITSRTYAKPFQFLNLGILAYTGGGSALAQVTPAPNVPSVKGSGKLGNAVWRSVYLSKQVSWRNRLLVLNDWTNRRLFGRDITRL